MGLSSPTLTDQVLGGCAATALVKRLLNGLRLVSRKNRIFEDGNVCSIGCRAVQPMAV